MSNHGYSGLVQPTLVFESGAQRSERKPPYWMIPRAGLAAIAKRFAKGAAKYKVHNWKKAIGSDDVEFVRQLVDHLEDHIQELKDLATRGPDAVDGEGEGLSDQCGAIAWAGMALATYVDEDPELVCKALNQKVVS